MYTNWQDLVIGIASIFYIISEAIIIFTPNKKPPVASAVITAFFDSLVFVAFASLGMWYSAITSAILFVEWVIIGVQSYKLDKLPAKHKS